MRFLRCAKIPIIRHWVKFNVVGPMGICIQIAAVYLFNSIIDVNSLWATALALRQRCSTILCGTNISLGPPAADSALFSRIQLNHRSRFYRRQCDFSFPVHK